MATRTCLVVGASSGIGLATAIELARRGSDLTLVARRGGALAAAEALCRAASPDSSGVRIEVVEADVASKDDVHDLVRRHRIAHDDALDAVVLAAAVMAYGRLEDLPVDIFETVVDTAVHGTMHLAREVLPLMRAQGHGVFVVINSLLGSITVPSMGAYATSKWGQRAVVRTLQQETRDEPDLHVCLVSPGSINTPIYELAANLTGRSARPPWPVLQPEWAGRKVADLVERPRRHLNTPLGPANPIVQTGYRVMPWVYDALVGPLFRVAALTGSTPVSTGSVSSPEPAKEGLHGRWPAGGTKRWATWRDRAAARR